MYKFLIQFQKFCLDSYISHTIKGISHGVRKAYR